MQPTEHHDSPHDTLIKALERVEEMESCLVIYEGKGGYKAGSFDSDLKVSDAIYLVELFRTWLMLHTLGVGD